ncbi:hypothetical protein [Streptosporangium longisporum]|uniref:Cell division protein FtsL n=1 Tax=Streptosporangium longisporum TaxID=46187 RepID=A0ABN3Y3F6_9ACTN
MPAAAGPVAGPATPVQAVPAARRRRAPRAPFLLLVVGLLCGGLVSLLLLNAVLAKDYFRASELRKDINELRLAREQKESVNMRLEMPGVLARNDENQGQQPDWDTARVIIPGASSGEVAGDTRAPAGRERVPGPAGE